MKTPKLTARLDANTGSECAGAGALSRPRASVCACVCPCRSLGRPWEPIPLRPERGAAAVGGRCSPRKKDNLYPQWPVAGEAAGRLGRDWSPPDAGRRAERRRTKNWSRCVLIGRTRGGRCLR